MITDKKYTMIVTEENNNHNLSFYANNPWEGNLSDITYGNNIDNWSLILNNDFVTKCNNEKEWEEEQQWLDNLPEDERKAAIINSWQRIFNLEAVNNDIRIAGSYIQATFWQLKKEMIRKVEYFTLTKHYHIF